MTIYDIARRQHGLITRDQLLDVIPGSTLGRWAADGRLERVLPAVYRIAGAPETWRQHVMAATLDSGGLASHRTSAALRGLDGHRGAVIEVLVERWGRSGCTVPYKVHETKDLRGPDFDVVDGIPCTSLVRTLIDLPAVDHRFRAEQALDHACRIDIANLALTRSRFVEVARRGRNGTTMMRRMLSERLGEYIPPDSSFESMALRLCTRFGLPEPSKQVKIEEVATGFVAYLDLAWPSAMVAMECDSLAFHFGKHAHEHDRRKRRGAKRLGWNVLEFTYEEVRDTPEVVARELRAALTSAAAGSGVKEAHIRA